MTEIHIILSAQRRRLALIEYEVERGERSSDDGTGSLVELAYRYGERDELRRLVEILEARRLELGAAALRAVTVAAARSERRQRVTGGAQVGGVARA